MTKKAYRKEKKRRVGWKARVKGSSWGMEAPYSVGDGMRAIGIQSYR